VTNRRKTRRQTPAQRREYREQVCCQQIRDAIYGLESALARHADLLGLSIGYLEGATRSNAHSLERLENSVYSIVRAIEQAHRRPVSWRDRMRIWWQNFRWASQAKSAAREWKQAVDSQLAKAQSENWRGSRRW
jgi:hypothetical protein